MTPTELTEECLAGCTESQREAIQYIRGPLLVLAGPGSGKTRVITRRICHLVASGVAADDILAITFTNKAANEMRERVQALGVKPGSWISTFHAFCARMLRLYGKHVGLTPSFTIYDTSDSLSVVKRAMEELEIDTGLFAPAAVARTISNSKNELRGPKEVRVTGSPDEAVTVGKVYARYDELLRSANAVDFDDLLILVVRLLQREDDLSQRLGRRFQHVLVDEYQDTNHAQYIIARQMAQGHRNLCVVGDPDQSIYGWRGADVNNILEFEQDWPDAKSVRLEQNYRSTKRILGAADALIAHNAKRKVKTLFTENSEGDPVRAVQVEDERAEADFIAADIAQRVRRGEIAPKDVAIFYRTNAQSRVLESALHREALPYTIVAGTEFFQRKEIKDLISYLRLVDNPADDVCVQRVANVPMRRLGDVSVDRLREWGTEHGLSLLQAFERAQEAGTRGPALHGIDEFLQILAALRALPRQPVAKLIEKLIEITRYEKYLSTSAENPQERIDNARELVNAAAEYDQAEPEGGLQGFLEQVALISDTDRWDAHRGGVTLMTLHAAKGLEFPAVYIIGLEEGLLPLIRNNGEHDLEEERRLLFVGITRAKRHVVLTHAESRARYGKRDFAEPSRFLEELPPEVDRRRVGDAATRTWGYAPTERPRTPTRTFNQFPAGMRRVKRDEHEEIVYDEEPPSDIEAPIHAGAPFRQGDSVVHPTYGRGTVLSLSGYGEDLRASVRFPTVGVKALVLKYARMRKA